MPDQWTPEQAQAERDHFLDQYRGWVIERLAIGAFEAGEGPDPGYGWDEIAITGYELLRLAVEIIEDMWPTDR